MRLKRPSDLVSQFGKKVTAGSELREQNVRTGRSEISRRGLWPESPFPAGGLCRLRTASRVVRGAGWSLAGPEAGVTSISFCDFSRDTVHRKKSSSSKVIALRELS